MISIKNLSKIYQSKQNEVTAVDNMNLTINKGEIYGVIGFSGAGKSTFVRLLNRLEEPTEGQIVMNEKDITKLKSRSLRQERQKIGMIFQHFNLLWSRTVFENIAFPLEIAGVPKDERKAKVSELIELVGLAGRENYYPSQLSGGQKQRVGIARALANDPKVLLCDEATSALDPQTTDDILDLLVSINERLGLTIILITHEMHVIKKVCHRVAVMEGGKVIEQGEVLDVFMRPKEKTTRRFVQQVMGTEQEEDPISTYVKAYKTGKVAKLHFVGDTANQPIISQIAKKFNLDINILQGNITQTKDGTYGSLYVHIDGDEEQINQAIQFVSETSVEVEVNGDA
ncbi:methionine ABC transporter ATP-binding protein [Salinibacillus xinjiangensis]|uniref:ATP-binding cassette domain-containing protein n=1 Tax=Salinibacillus xinjiangensis TaxID=1229268 RepID=A0A6G1X2I6_9BACI|nr:methionine ABC transporter ATP-binding protein [Salinibacillus xinjiangensis]MRG85154.1 ATP-binding cassette domain-containing protein [Salinibacillus xinjiangensis]